MKTLDYTRSFGENLRRLTNKVYLEKKNGHEDIRNKLPSPLQPNSSY